MGGKQGFWVCQPASGGIFLRSLLSIHGKATILNGHYLLLLSFIFQNPTELVTSSLVFLYISYT